MGYRVRQDLATKEQQQFIAHMYHMFIHSSADGHFIFCNTL